MMMEEAKIADSKKKAIDAIKSAIRIIESVFDKTHFVSIRVILNDLNQALKELEGE